RGAFRGVENHHVRLHRVARVPVLVPVRGGRPRVPLGTCLGHHASLLRRRVCARTRYAVWASISRPMLSTITVRATRSASESGTTLTTAKVYPEREVTATANAIIMRPSIDFHHRARVA